MTIRSANPGDAADIHSIYSYYVDSTAVSFKIDVPTGRNWIAR